MKWAVGIYDEWRKVRNAEQSDLLMHIPPLLQLTHDHEKLTDTICQMLSEARKKNGEEYPGSTLSDIIVMLNVYMKKNEVDVNLLSDTFHHVWTVLDTIMKSRNTQGVGIPNPKDAITVAEENILWEKGILDFEDPNTLCNTVLFTVGLHFGSHGGQEHKNLRRYPKCQIEREYKDKEDCMVYHEEHSKNNQGGILE